MPELLRETFSVIVNGENSYPPNVIKYSIDSDYTIPTDAWHFEVFLAEPSSRLRQTFLPLLPVDLFINSRLQVRGRIDRIDTGEGGSLIVSGRDYIADITCPNADPRIKFKKDDTLGDSILRVLAPFGITSIEDNGFSATRKILTGTTPNGKPPRDFRAAKLDEFKIGYGQGAFEVCNRLAARHGFTLQPATGRDKIALAEPDYDQAPIGKLTRGPNGGNVLQGKASRDWSKVPTTVTVTGKARGKRGASTGDKTFQAIGGNAPNRLADIAEVKAILKAVEVQSPELSDLPPEYGPVGTKAGFYFRPVYHQDKEAKNDEQVERVAKRILADMVRDTLTYQCTLRGHHDTVTGATYAVDTILQVEDEVERVSEPLWVMSCRRYNEGQGPFTDLQLIRPYTWVL